ncbi:MAG: Crp/Fnr family transcriptional regulator FnrL [Methyloligellaceae bacterium]
MSGRETAALAEARRTVFAARAVAEAASVAARPDPSEGRCASCIVRETGICNALLCAELSRFRCIASRRVFAPGQQIHAADERPEFFGAIMSGVVKMTKILFDGRQQVVGLLLPGDSVGRVFGRKTPYFTEAVTRVELCCFPYAGFERMLEAFPGLKQRLLEQTLDELDTALDWMVLLGRKTAEERVASLLVMLARRSRIRRRGKHGAPACAQTLELHLKREEIADFLGLTYETVCRQLSLLQKRGLIQLAGRKRVRVPDLGALALLAG